MTSKPVCVPLYARARNVLAYSACAACRSKLVYFLKIVSIFVALLFIDAFRTADFVVLKPEKEGFNSGLDGCANRPSHSATLSDSADVRCLKSPAETRTPWSPRIYNRASEFKRSCTPSFRVREGFQC